MVLTCDSPPPLPPKSRILPNTRFGTSQKSRTMVGKRAIKPGNMRETDRRIKNSTGGKEVIGISIFENQLCG